VWTATALVYKNADSIIERVRGTLWKLPRGGAFAQAAELVFRVYTQRKPLLVFHLGETTAAAKFLRSNARG
jgi:hypothetical protein